VRCVCLCGVWSVRCVSFGDVCVVGVACLCVCVCIGVVCLRKWCVCV